MKRNTLMNIYSSIVIAGGLVITFAGLQNVIINQSWAVFLLFSLLAIITESLPINFDESFYVSLSFAIAVAAILCMEPLAAASIMAMGIFFNVTEIEGKRTHFLNSSLFKRLFNVGAYVSSTLFAAYAYNYSKGFLSTFTVGDFSAFSVLAAVFVYVLANVTFYSVLFSLLSGKRLSETFVANSWIMRNSLLLGPLGVLMALAYVNWGAFALILIFGPFLLARYTFQLYLEMRNVYFNTIKTLSNAIDAKDEYTNGHSQRVAKYAVGIAQEMKLSPKRIERVKTSAILHDIGKIGIADSIINKPGKLNFNEFHSIKQHPEIGANIIKDVDFLFEESEIIRYHHERYDGMGYPSSLMMDEIPLEASIIAVADSYDAMTSDRAYRKAMPKEKALSIILSEAGKQFHPDVVESFLRMMDKYEESEEYAV